MNDVVSEPQQYLDHHPLLRRRSSISGSAPTNLLLRHHNSSSSSSSTATAATSSFSSFPSDDLELLSIKPTSQSHSYTSLKDLLPAAAVNSPKPSPAHQAHSGYDICIRNRLVKQAAWAYLQPMSTSPGSAGDGVFHRLWPRVAAFFDVVRRGVVRAVNWTLRVIWIRSSR